jgi:hypothetical protein
MTTFTTEDLESLLTDWFPGDVEPVNEGEYDIMTDHWPWPHRVLWTKKLGWDSMEPVNQWRGLKIRITE